MEPQGGAERNAREKVLHEFGDKKTDHGTSISRKKYRAITREQMERLLYGAFLAGCAYQERGWKD